MNRTSSLALGNELLERLPADVCARLRHDLQEVELPVGKVLYESYARQHSMFFPRSGIVSLLFVLQNGDTSEIAMVGREGVVGMSLIVDSQSTPSRAVVQVAGEALMLPGEAVEREFGRNGRFHFAVLRYGQALLAQMAQTGVCNRHHTVERQLCRWLLMSLDRLGPVDLKMTQEQIAHLLGVRRGGITEAAKKLQTDGVIDYSRGTIRVITATNCSPEPASATAWSAASTSDCWAAARRFRTRPNAGP
ncbi:Crp/Fnr family transcriptional regulator [Agrilutibacter solisilvae]|uniref:CRP-like protein Clp n=1 Tax=Agrilutibacter solisilvae TaxID=2763317 RepID=A0A974Y2L5_9GAMM|nr:Crp/Fnr family transcriptional regulator [Lysobacter solisilvae]QSX79460.1 Crp/Fnr family transcriptional regulator [Lysobacter solisilvae]